MISKKKTLELSVFSNAIRRLEAAFRIPQLSDSSFEVYWNANKNESEERFLREVETIIKTEHTFPTIARLLKRDWREA